MATARRYEIVATDLSSIAEFRESYRRSMDAQIVHDSLHARGMLDEFAAVADGRTVGYVSLGGDDGRRRDVVKEFFVGRDHRSDATEILRRCIAATSARWIEAQTNDRLLAFLLFDTSSDWMVTTVLFDAGAATDLQIRGGNVRRLSAAELSSVFTHTSEPVGSWGLEVEGTIVATGGFLDHYNPPYADLYMEVHPGHRRKGYGSYLVQELKRRCIEDGYRPSARCRISNHASRATLQRAGMAPCAHIVRGRIARSPRVRS